MYAKGHIGKDETEQEHKANNKMESSLVPGIGSNEPKAGIHYATKAKDRYD